MDRHLPGVFGIQLVAIEHGTAELRMDLRDQFMAPNGFLHAGTVITLADTACGMGCRASLPEGATGFTTLELKSNFLRSAEGGDGLSCRAAIAHAGRTTQVWDATVTRESDGKPLAVFRCTQFLMRGEGR
ncbi:MAG: 1,4-dihydroxy-2-naphthoyl-CoA hydrolase [Thermoleophilaceae bacterium]|jgi:uncharacterized protein (TIGR00369 family)|nr:1,4-dihydroxy-2-naphthoyl-CoA hydrolase [Thermoleophilaceae bacterium]